MRQRSGSCFQKNGRPAAQRAAVAHLQAELGLSERRACLIAGADRTMVRHRSRRPPDTELRARLREHANERRRFGYRRLFVLLRREVERSGINRIHRLYAATFTATGDRLRDPTSSTNRPLLHPRQSAYNTPISPRPLRAAIELQGCRPPDCVDREVEDGNAIQQLGSIKRRTTKHPCLSVTRRPAAQTAILRTIA